MKKYLKSIYKWWKEYRADKTKKLNHIISKRDREEKELKSLVNEYNIIQLKKSNLSKSQRDRVENKISELIRSGKIQIKI